MPSIVTLHTEKYAIKLDNFQGPLDLLCNLIEKNKMDIYDIKLDEITDQYIEYLKQAEELNLELASEFVTMASTLLYLKSKKLLPGKQIDEEEISEDELIRRIIEYKKYKDITEKLKHNFEKNSLRFYKLPENIEEIYHGFSDESVFNINDLPKLSIPDRAPDKCDTYKIRRFDLDINKHVHNLNYLDYAYELLPQNVYDGEELNNVEICYKKEIKYGDTIKSFLYIEDNVYTIIIKSEDENTVHAIIKIY